MMRFKEYIKMKEDDSSQEQGAFIHTNSKETIGNAPSDGQPFSDYLSHISGARQGQSGGMGGGMPTGMGGAMMMKKMMRKMMLKKMRK